MKKTNTLFSAFATLSIANSVAYLLFTEQSIMLLGGQITGIALLMTKYYGAIALGCGLGFWLLRKSKDKQTIKIMVIAIFISMLASSIIGIYAYANLWFNNFAWLFIIIDSSLTFWSGYILIYLKKK